jgi:hypothetical protein
VGDEDHGRVERLQLALEPLEARHVEVVRRLVEEQEIGVAAERPGKGCPRQLPSREAGKRPLEIRRREAEVAGDRVEPLTPRVPTCVLEARLRLGVALQGRGGVIP